MSYLRERNTNILTYQLFSSSWTNFSLHQNCNFKARHATGFKMNVMFLMFLLSPQSSDSSRFNNTVDSHDYEIVAICVNMLFLLLMWYKAPAKQLAQSSALASLTGLGKCLRVCRVGLTGGSLACLSTCSVGKCTVPM